MCCGNPRSLPFSEGGVGWGAGGVFFLTPEKKKRPVRQNCHLQCRSCPEGGKKEKGSQNQWSCINLLTANVLYILILDPLPARLSQPPDKPPLCHHHQHPPSGPTFSPSILWHIQRCHIKRGKSTSRAPFEVGRSNCH